MPAMPPAPVRFVIYTLTIAGWIALVLRAFVPLFDVIITDDQARLALLLAALGTSKWLLRRMMHPAHELFVAGKMVGHAEAQLELQAENVTPLRPELRIIGGRSATE